MVRVGNDQFLSQAALLFEKTRDKGSIFMTFKKCQEKDGESKVLMRVTDGKAKHSTLVRAADVARFHAELSVLLRANASALKKKDRKSKKSRSKSQAAQ